MDTFLSIDYPTWWFLILGAAITGYAVLDGFDLGVGAIHLFFRGEQERRTSINSIGPVWDGNEVWLIITGGVLFAAFPPVYAAMFSGFYVYLMLLLVMLIFRAVSIEFRSKEPMAWWRRSWDISFSVSSILIALALGLTLGNMLIGVPLESHKEFTSSSPLSLINVFSVLVAITTLALFMMHGSLYLIMKTQGKLYTRLIFISRNATIFFVISFVMLTLYTLLYVPALSAKIRENEWLFFIPILIILAIANIPRQLTKGRYFGAFISSAVVIASMLVLVAVELFPVLMPSTLDPNYSLTVYNASASTKSLNIMLIIAMIALPLVATYTTFVFWTFRGKVKLDEHSY